MASVSNQVVLTRLRVFIAKPTEELSKETQIPTEKCRVKLSSRILIEVSHTEPES